MNSMYLTLSYWQTITLSVSKRSGMSCSITSSPEFRGSYWTEIVFKQLKRTTKDMLGEKNTTNTFLGQCRDVLAAKK